ncbi:MAG: hypothetical protein FWH23_07680 [Bacteroidales bacterium]|nr:hypothetical protein [Bacteroidales bacterium]MCL2133374.1 hypothetical protein [Bacteroidales bacterium]
MKKIFLLLLIAPFLGVATAQTAWDGLQFSQNFYGGTARFTAMGGAFAALGGDFSSLSVNPAGIGVFRSWDIMFTPSVSYNITDAKYIGETNSDSYSSFGFDNIGLVFDIFDSDALRFNLGIGYNKLNHYIDRTSAYGVNNNNSYAAAIAMATDGIETSVLNGNDAWDQANWASVLGWDTWLLEEDGASNKYIAATQNYSLTGTPVHGGPLKQSYYKETSGNTNEFVFCFGGNLHDQFYFGMNIGIQNIWREIYESFTEQAVNPTDFHVGFNRFIHESEVETRGIGCNIKLGILWRPVEGLRWGAYFHTPTWMYLTDKYRQYMHTWFNATASAPRADYSAESPEGVYDYKVTTPFKWGTGLAYIFNNMAIISVEYEGLNYASTRMSGYDGHRYTKLPYSGSETNYRFVDDYTKDNFGLVTNLRVGAELRLNPVSIRAGFAHYGSPLKNNSNFSSNIISLGLGYDGGSFYIDGAYSGALGSDRDYTLYEGSPVMTANSYLGKVAVTLGFRF